jgi:cysteine-rich secretory family protein
MRAVGAVVLAACALGPPQDGGDPGGREEGVCAEPPVAYAVLNESRRAAGSPCASFVPALADSATRHCAYWAANAGEAACVRDPHAEVMGCPGYWGARFVERELRSGYAGTPSSETMAFGAPGAAAVQLWIDSVWHRTPVLSPWVRDVGFGAAEDCVTADFGIGAGSSDAKLVTWPYPGQTAVPRSFDGATEGPEPPRPPGGWPSGYPITIFARSALSAHALTVASTGAAVPHVWLAPGSAESRGLLDSAYVLYAEAPLAAATTYRVTAAGGGSDIDFTFTTRGD